MSKWHLIENHPLLKEIYQDPRIISYKRQKYLKDISKEPNSKGRVYNMGDTSRSRVRPVNTLKHLYKYFVNFDIKCSQNAAETG